jgi:septal ring factor EnvC (AmiA/AmiB activator)
MPLLQEPTNQTHQTEKPTDSQVSANPSSKGLFTLPDSVMKLVPWIPFILEATTGQKIPQMSGTIGEIQQGINQIQMTQVQINQRLTTLEIKQSETQTKLSEIQTNANQHLSNLTHQFNSLRLTHTREKESKQIAYHNQPDNSEENY